MTRRIVVAIAATALVTLVVTSALAFGLARLNARDAAAEAVGERAPEVASQIGTGLRRVNVTADDDRQATLRSVLAAIRSSLEGAAVETHLAAASGGLVERDPVGSIAEGALTEAEVTSVGDGDPTSVIVRDGVAYGIAAIDLTAGRRLIVVVREDVGVELGPVGRWFLLAALGGLALAVVTAVRLARRIGEPVEPITAATRTIAAGHFETRVEHDASWPSEMIELGRAVNDMAATLERSQGLEQQFLMSVSHDLRTPLTSIRGFAEALADGTAAVDPETATRSAEVIVAQSRRLERLVQDLLELARLDARQFSLNVRATDIGHLATTTAGGFAPAAADADIALHVEIHPGPALVAAIDPDRMAQVMANLLENATKYAANEITVRATRAGDQIELAVEDDGPGIAEHDLPHVFERLYVTKRQPTRQEVGSGLGLAIVAELAAAMGGSTSARRSPLGGASLVVSVPAVMAR